MSRTIEQTRRDVTVSLSLSQSGRLDQNACMQFAGIAIGVVVLCQCAFLLFGCDWDFSGDEAEFWIKLAPQGDMIFIPEALAYRTLWSGNETPPHTDRLLISRYLKGRVLEQLGAQPGAPLPATTFFKSRDGRVPGPIVSVPSCP